MTTPSAAQDCDTHDNTIRTLQTQVSALEVSLSRTESARLSLLSFLFAVDDLVKSPRADLTTTQLLAWLARASRKTHAAHTRDWSGAS